ncbi:MAG: hypothetical protein NVSMB68_04830 [Thermoanaerobaculia bacterium]
MQVRTEEGYFLRIAKRSDMLLDRAQADKSSGDPTRSQMHSVGAPQAIYATELQVPQCYVLRCGSDGSLGKM